MVCMSGQNQHGQCKVPVLGVGVSHVRAVTVAYPIGIYFHEDTAVCFSVCTGERIAMLDMADVDPTDIVDDLRLALRKRLVMALATTLRRALTVRPSM